jgi:diguanylate cyclase (GGDEF)-like protein
VASDLQSSILNQCIDIDSVAFQVYASFVQTETSATVRELWASLGRDEAEHITYWRLLMRYHEEGIVPDLFEDAVNLNRTLEDSSRKMHLLMGTITPDMDSQKRLTVACLMELTFLHQPLLQALRYVKSEAGAEEPLDAYDRHLRTFLTGVGTHVTALDLQLSVDALKRLWDDTKGLLSRAFTDPLTGLLNRRGLRDTAVPLVNLAKRNGSTLAVAMVDIDKFKSINDTHGHDTGDRVLVWTAGVIRRTVRGSDLVARVGGEEFVVFLSDVDETCLPEIGEKIRSEVERHPVEGIPVTVSLGIAARAMARESDVSAVLESLMKEADERLYRAKAEGRNRVVV